MDLADPLSTAISITALVVSGVTAWFTLLRRGRVRMTKPAIIVFAYDQMRAGPPKAKVFLRALLYSTGKRGHVIESMYLTLSRGEMRQTFNVWGYGDEKLVRGSGLFVGEAGVAANHHFNPPNDVSEFNFLPGNYELDIFASLVGFAGPAHLCSVELSVEESAGPFLQEAASAVWFDWAADSKTYNTSYETPIGYPVVRSEPNT